MIAGRHFYYCAKWHFLAQQGEIEKQVGRLAGRQQVMVKQAEHGLNPFKIQKRLSPLSLSLSL